MREISNVAPRRCTFRNTSGQCCRTVLSAQNRGRQCFRHPAPIPRRFRHPAGAPHLPKTLTPAHLGKRGSGISEELARAIIATIKSRYGLRRAAIAGHPEARRVAAYLLACDGKMGSSQVGRLLGWRWRNSVFYAVAAVEAERRAAPDFRLRFCRLREEVWQRHLMVRYAS